MSDITLWGFDGSTYVRTVKMLLAEKSLTTFKQVPPKVPCSQMAARLSA